MKTYEFLATVTHDGRLIIPAAYASEIPAGGSVRVIILVGEEDGSPDGRDELNGSASLEEVVNEIKSSGQNPANIQPASGLLAEHLTNCPEIPDPSFDITTWNREWDEIEAEMKVMEIAEQKSETDFEVQ